MRIVNLKTFRSMPKGTVFMKYNTAYFGDLCVKDINCGERDFFFTNITNEFDNTGTEDWLDKIRSMEEDSTVNEPVDFGVLERDGMFLDDQLFAVYTDEDVQTLINKLTECLK